MFFEGDRIDAMREMILADNLADREAALAKLLPYQRADFFGIFKALKGFPATIRFLDPPLHEFLPNSAESAGRPGEEARHLARQDHAARPRAPRVQPHARLPRLPPRHQVSRDHRHAGPRRLRGRRRRQQGRLQGEARDHDPAGRLQAELDLQVAVVHEVAKAVQAEKKTKISYSVGTMIEIPRGALTADEIAETAEFFSFGTNDLTQTCLGMSRDDSGSFLGAYQEAEIMKKNPFASVDQTGVGQLMKIAIEKGSQDPPGHQARHLRRARRRPGLGQVLPQDRPHLRVLQPVPRAGRRLAAAQAAVADLKAKKHPPWGDRQSRKPWRHLPAAVEVRRGRVVRLAL
jgi:pyruvate,orthophosphate dikinase